MGLFNKIKSVLSKNEEEDDSTDSSLMNHEIYISHSDNDKQIADELSDIFKLNGVNCWIKHSKDIEFIEKIKAIENSQLMIVIYSNSFKNEKNYLEIEYAYSNHIPCLIFKIDEAKFDNDLERLLRYSHFRDLFDEILQDPDTKGKYGNIIKDSLKLLGKPSSNIIFSNTIESIEDLDSEEPINNFNFKYLENLIHSGQKEIILDSDIILTENDLNRPIKLDIDNILIDGNGHSIDAKGKNGIFLISAKGITIKDIALKNASSSKLGGAAIHNYGGIINLINVKICNNVTRFNGGGIYNNGGEIELSNCEISNNASLEGDGEAIYNGGGKIKILNTFISHNSSEKVDGSAIYIYNGKVDILNSLIAENHSKNNIISNFDTLTIDNNTVFEKNISENLILNNGKLAIHYAVFKNNTLEKSIIYSNGQYCNISRTKFNNNHSKYSIFNNSYLTLDKLEIDDFDNGILNNENILIKSFSGDFEKIIENHGIIKENIIPKEQKYGFAYLDNLIRSSKSKKIKLDHDIYLKDYEIDFYEGGIDLDIDGLIINGDGKSIDGAEKSRIFLVTGKNITLENIVFKNGAAFENIDSPYNDFGGSIQNNSKSTLNIKNCIFNDNKSEKQGGAISNRGKIKVIDSSFKNNSAYKGSGAIYNCQGEMELTNSIFEGNYVKENDLKYGSKSDYPSYGGTLNNLKGAKMTINSCKITASKLEGFRCYGGAIHNFGQLEIIESILSDNSSQRNGGMLYNDKGEVKMVECTIKNNLALNGDGGAVYNYHGKISIYDTELNNNHAKYDGGAIHNSDEIIILNSRINKNSVDLRNGGGIFNQGKGLIKDSSLNENNALSGGGIWTNNSRFIIENCILTSNKTNDIERAILD